MSRRFPRFHRISPLPPESPSGTNVYELALQGRVQGQVTVNTFYYYTVTGVPPSEAEQNALLTVTDGGLTPSFVACCASDWQLEARFIRCLNSVTVPPAASVLDTPTPGGNVAPSAPTTLAVVMTRYSTLRGQSGRGRLYVPAVPLAAVVGSTLDSAFVGPYQTLRTAMQLHLTSGGNSYIPCIVSRRLQAAPNGGLLPPGVIRFTDQTDITIRLVLGTVRRRRIGRGV
jgi:hypothetical protein